VTDREHVDGRPAWWPTFGKILAAISCWYGLAFVVVLLLIGLPLWRTPVRSGTDGLILVLATLWLTIVFVGAIVIGLVLGAVSASFRPRRPYLWGTACALGSVALTIALLPIINK
jgi:hypothetical protein